MTEQSKSARKIQNHLPLLDFTTIGVRRKMVRLSNGVPVNVRARALGRGYWAVQMSAIDAMIYRAPILSIFINSPIENAQLDAIIPEDDREFLVESLSRVPHLKTAKV